MLIMKGDFNMKHLKTKIAVLVLALLMIVSAVPMFSVSALTIRGTTDDGFSYFINVNGEAFIEDYTGTETSVYVPSRIYDSSTGKYYPVVDIGEAFSGKGKITEVSIAAQLDRLPYRAFADCYSLQTISLPSSLTKIDQSAFYLCMSLERIAIPYNVTEIGPYAFMGCYALNTVNLPSKLESIDSGAFSDCYDLRYIEIPYGCTYIGNYAFFATGLYDLDIPGSVKTIGFGAFRDCYLLELSIPDSVAEIRDEAFACNYDLTEVTIPAGATKIGKRVFAECPSLESLKIDENNPVYDSRGDCNAIIETATDTLIAGCINSTIPEGVKVIGASAFESNLQLNRYGVRNYIDLTIPEGVVSIEEGAFHYCDAIKSITIPTSVTSIKEAFRGCDSLTDVYYLGSEKQWNDISIEGKGVTVNNDNEDLLNANIHFAKASPSEDLTFSGASLTLQDNISVNFKADESLFGETGYENPYVVYEMNGETFTVSEYEVVDGKYVFDFADIAPNNMNDTVKATMYATFDGEEYASETKEYSVATYCYNMLNKYTEPEYKELQTLLVDLLNYGAASQIYTNHNTENLVNEDLTEEQKALATGKAPVYESVQNLTYKTIDNPTVQWKGAGLNLVDAVTMRFKITADSASYENLEVKVETDDRIWTIPYEEFSETTGGYYVYFSGLNAGEMSEPVYLTVYENDEAVSNTLSYSIESYAYSKQNSTDTNLVNLLEAMMKYGNSAYAYAN